MTEQLAPRQSASYGGAAAKQTEQALGNGNKLARAKPLGPLEAAMNF